MKVGVFLATTSDHPSKRKYMDAFTNGIVAASDDEVFITNSKDYKECDLAVIFGFYGINMGPMQKIRRHIFKEHSKRKKKCMFIDADLFRFLGKKEAEKNSDDLTHVRISYQSIFFPEAIHFNEHCDARRWELISSRKQIQLQPFRTDGDHILICLNSNPHTSFGWSADKINIYEWARHTVHDVRKETDRKIIIRFHPNAKEQEKENLPLQMFSAYPDVFFSGGVEVPSSRVIKNTSLADDCQNAWACVAYTTSASITPLVYGIPVFTEMNRCPLYPVANHSLKLINHPKEIDRQQWIWNASYCLWNYHEINNGEMWKRYRARLNNKGEYSKAAAEELGLR